MPRQRYGCNHATWCRSIFFRGYAPTSGEPLTENHIDRFTQALAAGGIRYAYIFSGPFDERGGLPAWAFSDRALRSIERMRASYPALNILPWVGGVYGKTLRIDRREWIANATESVARLVGRLPVDGVHVDMECPIEAVDGLSMNDRAQRRYVDGVFNFHDGLRRAFPRLFISSVVVSTASGTRPWKRKHSLDELAALYPNVDQISFLYYDTAIRDRGAFVDNFDEQVDHLAVLRSAARSRVPQVLIGVGTFVNEPALRAYRDLRMENLRHTMQVIRNALNKRNSSRALVDGLAVYCEWHTTSAQWKQLREEW